MSTLSLRANGTRARSPSIIRPAQTFHSGSDQVDTGLQEILVQFFERLTLEDCYSLAAFLSDIDSKLDEFLALLKALRSSPEQSSNTPKSYSVAEIADIVGRAEFTVREWARTGRIDAYRGTSRGPYGVWRISQESLHYYQTFGLLPPRN
jgi:hypothetical protein